MEFLQARPGNRTDMENPESPNPYPRQSAVSSSGRHHPSSPKVSVHTTNQIVPANAPTPAAGQGGFAYFKTLGGILRTVSLICVVIGFTLAFHSYPLKLLEVTAAGNPMMHLYSYGKITDEDSLKQFIQMSQGSHSSLRRRRQTGSQSLDTSDMAYRLQGRQYSIPKFQLVKIDVWQTGYVKAGYGNQIDYAVTMFEMYRTHYMLSGLVIVFIIVFLIMMVAGKQVGNRAFTRWTYGIIVGGLLLIAEIGGAVAASALSCTFETWKRGTTGPESGAWLTEYMCGGDSPGKVSMPTSWIIYDIGVASTGIGCVLGIVCAIVFP